MKLGISNKTASFVKKPLIKKGFYPAKFLGYKATKNDGTPITGKFGEMIILEFAIFKPTEDGTPTEAMRIKESNKTSDVILDKFVYTSYKDKKTNELQSSITPNSKPTKTFKALGWEPDFENELQIDLDELIGNWVEVLIEDWEATNEDDSKYTCSSINTVDKYQAEKPSEEVEAKAEEVKENAKPKKVEKEVKHEDVEKAKKKLSPEIEQKIAQLKELKDSGALTESGFNQAMEQLEGL